MLQRSQHIATAADLRGRTVVITGASSGIGRASALEFARAGARLVLAARGEAALTRVAEECRAFGAAVLVVPTDVASAPAVRDLATAALDWSGGVDVWVNNAGVGAVGSFEETPMSIHEQIVRTDLIGYMHGVHAILPHFKARKSGVFVNVLSLGSFTPSPYAAAYSAAKFGLRGFTEALGGELSRFPGIHVCDVYPSFVDTPGMTNGANFVARELKPPPGIVDAEAVARAVVGVAARPRRQVVVGRGMSALARLAHALLPGTTMWAMARLMELYFTIARPVARQPGNVFAASRHTAISGGFKRPGARALVTLAGGIGLIGLAAAGLANGASSRRRRRAQARRIAGASPG